ncbi:PREDICTED: uncharacterized protein LOC104609669 [Nelumbo nucifera]|uniref:Uncharacterized protein LOC104609669 n=2 Tax=Nelumbo nucifera TaxID=4432 RepID=A0A1U8QB73_NELNU|nr:PREDICTED: uncharacterized protein LOC104609669 [Nelumbo nucifera]DAD24539.1 TPA_asm: hypothetical protein HUJ06_026003 [Nelumbo nucifera]
MALRMVHRPMLSNSKSRFHFRNTSSPKHSDRHSIPSPNFSNSFLQSKPLASRNWVETRVHSFHPWSSPLRQPKRRLVLEAVILFAFFMILLCIHILLSILPPDFPQRWHRLIVFSEEMDARASNYPSHLWQAVVAYEDRRFFRHCGIDPVGIARAVLSLSASGGGSTITQQLVKNTLLKNERTLARKIIEVILALILERKMSKWKILNSYLSKIYWGHGIYGIESASAFYFGKHPSLLRLGESAMLAGIIPSPEARSPLRDPSRGKSSQARALRRMVEAGFIDIEVALFVVNQPLLLCVEGPELVAGKDAGNSDKQSGRNSTTKEIWDWKRQSSIWEVRENMELWATKVRRRSVGKSK